MWLSGLRTQLVSMRMQVGSLASLSGLGSGVAVSCGVGYRCGSDPVWLWLWRRLAAAASIQPRAWEPPYAAGASKKENKQNKRVRICERLVQERVNFESSLEDDEAQS